MSNTLKYILGVIVAALIVLGIFAATRRAKAPSPEEEAAKSVASGPIKIGVMAPLTGDAAVYGEPLSNVLRLAAEEVNAAGGLAGKQMELVIEDSRCNGKDGANAAQKLVNVDKVQAIIGGFCSSESLAAVPIAAQAKVFLFSAGSSSPDLTGINMFFVRNYPSDASQGKVLADLAFGDKNWRRVAFMQEQTDYALGVFKAFSATFEALGGKVVKEEFPSQTTDFRSLLTKLQAQKANALFIDTQTPAVAARILKQMQELKWVPALMVNDAISGDPDTVAKNASMLEGALAAEFGTNPANPKFQHMLETYKAKHGAEPPYQSYAQTEYDAVFMLRDAIKDVGNNGEMLATWFRMAKDWDGASGKVTIGQDGDRVGGHTPKVIKGGRVGVYIK